jgi:hypothetical protein
MTEFEAFEAELAALQPRQPSAELKSRIAHSLERTTTSPIKAPSGRVGMRVAIFGGLVAAGLAAVVIWWERVLPIRRDPQTIPVESLLATPFEPGASSVWSYRSALVRSPISIESLLDQHSVEGRAAKSGDWSIHAFARLDSNMNDIFGEL